MSKLHAISGGHLTASALFCLSVTWTLSSLTPLAAAPPQVLHGHVPPAITSLQPIGRLPATNRLSLVLALPVRDKPALAGLLEELYNPASPKYRQFLTAEQFADRFGPAAADYQALAAFAQAHDLVITGTHPNRTLLDVSGTVADIEKALHVTMHVYQHPTESRTFYAPDTEPSVDLDLPLLDIRGLDNFHLPQHALKWTPIDEVTPRPYAVGSGPGGTFLGKDFRQAYAPGVSLDGSGQNVALFEMDGYYGTDITNYEKLANYPYVPLTNVLVDGFAGHPVSPGAVIEVSLDIEMAIAMAPGLTSVLVYEGALLPTVPYDMLNRMATDNLAKEISSSWVITEIVNSPIPDQIYQQFGAQGQTFFQASGDEGAYPVFQWSDDPYITIVGGTTLSTRGTNGAWGSETTWTPFSGGGVSSPLLGNYPIPSYQLGIDMTTNMGSTTMRNVPDVALTADNIFVIADNGASGAVSGTSCAAPLWAGYAALINQQAYFNTQPLLGLLNPAVYTIGKGTNYRGNFHDITTGNNTNSVSPTNYYACAGYDLCTGWGTPTGSNIINYLAPLGLQILPGTGFSAVGPPGGPFSVTTQTYALTNVGAASAVWSVVNTTAWLNASATNGTLTQAHGASVTVSLNAAASNLAVGTYSATVVFTNQTSGGIQTRQFSLGVQPVPPFILAQPVSLAVPVGSNALFKVNAYGTPPVYYQWQRNAINLSDGGNVSGSTTSNLLLTSVSLSDSADYSVIVSNALGFVVSSNALLVVEESPVITNQPQSLTLALGQDAVFAVGVSGTTPLFYQWHFNGTPVAGATGSSITVTNAQLTNDGLFSVSVSNLLGGVISSNALLSIVALSAVGDDSFGQIDIPYNATNVIGIAAGAWHSLALRQDGTVLAWGDNFNGQCDVPANLGGVVALAAGGYHTLALRTNQTVVAWGGNDSGQATPPSNLSGVSGVSAGTWHSLALLTNGTVVAWGDNTWGQTSVPPGLTNAVAVAAGGSHSLALRAYGTVLAWGQDSDDSGNFAGQCQVPFGLANAVSLAAGEYHSLAVESGGAIVLWGDNSQGQSQPQPALTNVVALAGGGAHSLALKADGTVAAWGDDTSGQCGFSPMLESVVEVAAGESHSLALVGNVSASAPLTASFVQTNHTLSLSLPTQAGRLYALQYKALLTNPNWTTLQFFTGTGSTITLTDSTATNSRRFYRVVRW